MYLEKARTYFRQFVFTLKKHREAVDFIYEHRLWEGFWKYGWVARLFVIIGVLISLKFLSILFNWLTQADASNPQAVISSMSTLVTEIASEGYHFLFFGGMKYIMIILLEIIIFHVCRRTLAILTNEKTDAGFQAFVQAQIRMIKVAIYSWVMEMVITIILKVFFGIFGFIDFLQPVLVFAVQCYYLGFAVLDNYHEQFHMKIKESARYARDFAGVALAVGLLLQGFFTIPLAGAIAGPFVAAVAVTLAMFELSDLHLRSKTQETVATPLSSQEDIV